MGGGIWKCHVCFSRWIVDCETKTIAARPQIEPPTANLTVNPRQTAVLGCNATGNPEPVVTWVKVPNEEQIQASESE